MFLILEDVTKLIWGANPYYVSEPYSLFGNVDIGHQTYVGYDFALARPGHRHRRWRCGGA